MEVIAAHFQNYYVYYIILIVLVLPAFYYFRRFTFPVMGQAIEFAAYAALTHVFVHVVVALANWFKSESTMKRAFGEIGADYDPGWGTPWLYFWDRALYDPRWLFYFELVILAVILFLMWRLRPLHLQRPSKKPVVSAKKYSGSAVAPGKRLGGHK